MYFDDYASPVFSQPSEARSFILRLTRGCAHNKCTYCNMYRGVPFQVLTDEQIMRQIAMAQAYNAKAVRRVFFADGDALVLSTERLLRVLKTLREVFPNFERASSYAAPKDILRKSVDELRELREAGLELLYYGMETGDGVTLAKINKGVDDKESIEVGQRVIAAGMKLSMMIILGIAGEDGSERHALETAKAINAIRPTMLGAICLMLYRGSRLLLCSSLLTGKPSLLRLFLRKADDVGRVSHSRPHLVEGVVPYAVLVSHKRLPAVEVSAQLAFHYHRLVAVLLPAAVAAPCRA